ncbi:MAG: efflux RND transporter periplasmic adaptor subunit [Candidatus Binatia bacterium]
MRLQVLCLPLVVAAAFWAGCTRSLEGDADAAEAKAVAVPVTVAPVVARPSVRAVNFVGTLYGNQDVTLSSQVDGQITVLKADLGDAVTEGQVLAQIDDDQLRARLQETEAMLAKAQADEARGRQLVGEKVISPQEYESMKTQAAVARAQTETLRVTIRHARVESPITGAVAKRFVSAGEYVHPGSQLFTLVAEDPLKLRGDVPERFAHELQIGQPVEVRVDAFPDRPFTGRLARISPASNPENRSVAIEALVDNADRALKPGFFANAGIITRTDDRALMVPQEAVITFAGVTKLFVVKDGVAHERKVRVGTRGSAGMVEVTEGLEPDESVATSGLTKLENGIAVSVKESAGGTHGRAS